MKSLFYDEIVLRAECRDAKGEWQEVMVFDSCIDSRFALNNPDGFYRCEIERSGRLRTEQFRIVRHQLAAAK
jgi:hypothetical protein